MELSVLPFSMRNGEKRHFKNILQFFSNVKFRINRLVCPCIIVISYSVPHLLVSRILKPHFFSTPVPWHQQTNKGLSNEIALNVSILKTYQKY